jgi:hypothetical protein
MYARWASFGVGLWLVLAPLLLRYRAVGPILHDVAMGLLVCVGTLAALERPAFRFALAAPALWLLWTGRGAEQGAVAIAEVASGAALLLLAVVPSARRVERPAPAGRAP